MCQSSWKDICDLYPPRRGWSQLQSKNERLSRLCWEVRFCQVSLSTAREEGGVQRQQQSWRNFQWMWTYTFSASTVSCGCWESVGRGQPLVPDYPGLNVSSTFYSMCNCRQMLWHLHLCYPPLESGENNGALHRGGCEVPVLRKWSMSYRNFSYSIVLRKYKRILIVPFIHQYLIFAS